MTARPHAVPALRLTAAALAAGLAVATAAGCAPDTTPTPTATAHATSPTASPTASTPPASGGRPVKPLAVLTGQHHLALTLLSARRSPHGAVTVRGLLKNTGKDLVVVPAELRGNETAVLKNGPSLAGATLVDFTGGKRYYVLRDTDARPLTTTGLSQLQGGESVPVFVQFPAPPASTSRVDFELPLFDSATITLSK
ncbi:hypothetical protein [Streptomyces sp. NPDC096032]|uniref:hypothetical protein n=1 Tax=Streptomyces sp. NPDC096032 TaxID=3366070 RepID=UPI00381FD7CF